MRNLQCFVNSEGSSSVYDLQAIETRDEISNWLYRPLFFGTCRETTEKPSFEAVLILNIVQAGYISHKKNF